MPTETTEATATLLILKGRPGKPDEKTPINYVILESYHLHRLQVEVLPVSPLCLPEVFCCSTSPSCVENTGASFGLS